MNGQVCGQAVTQQQMLDGEAKIVYVIDVNGAGQQAGCGLPGQRVTFEVGNQVMGSYEFWTNNQVCRVDLSLAPGTPACLGQRLYLPLVLAGTTATNQAQEFPLIPSSMEGLPVKLYLPLVFH